MGGIFLAQAIVFAFAVYLLCEGGSTRFSYRWLPVSTWWVLSVAAGHVARRCAPSAAASYAMMDLKSV